MNQPHPTGRARHPLNQAGNRDLARTAGQTAATHTPGSLARKAWGCAAVALATTPTIPAARSALDAWDGPADVKTSALAILGGLGEPPPKD